MSIPNEFICPISMDLMIDPVIAPDGHTYERSAITEWLFTNNTSPLTRIHMTVDELQTNFALKSAIERWKLSNDTLLVQQALPNIIQNKTFRINATKSDDNLILDIDTAHRTPMETILIAVLDVSGSMDSSSSNKKSEEGGEFSRLDLVKHSMLTLATLLNSEYQTTSSSLGIITFSNTGKLVMPITKMDTVGLNTATTAIKSLKTEGATNIWDGLRIGLLQAATAIERNPNANIQILLLTDGEPSSDLLPPLGIEKTLKRKLNTIKGRVSISTFGFGYNLDCDLLESICELGNGTYGFIPDCSMVGTVFINWAAKALLTLAHHISIKTPITTYQVGDIILGRSQKLIIPYSKLSTVDITYDNGISDTIPLVLTNNLDNDIIYLDKLTESVRNLKKYRCYDSLNTDDILALKTEIISLESSSEFMKDIVADIESEDENEGQLTKACIKKWWYSWGRNHLLAYYHALKLQQCVNFKDKVLQHFASDEFKELQEKGIDIFSSLPVPIPTALYSGGGQRYSFWNANSPGPVAPNPSVPASIFGGPIALNPSVPASIFGGAGAVASMASYVSSAGPCFSGNCKVKMNDNSYKAVKDLQKGDKVLGGHKVLAILKTPVNKKVDMVVFEGGLIITPWHPMKVSNESPWVFPNTVEMTYSIYMDYYYNLVLETGHIVEMNDYPVVTLGHGFTDNDIIRHPYFGTLAIIDDLMKHPSWESGILEISPNSIERNSESGLITKIY
jgi:Mg-chelatase subunit ChlD